MQKSGFTLIVKTVFFYYKENDFLYALIIV